MCWRPASRRRAARARCFSMASRSSPTVGGRSCCRWRRRAITSSPPTSAAMGAPRAGMAPTTPMAIPSASSTWCGMRSGLVYALGYRSVAGVVGHDAGSPVASWCAVIRPDIFRRLALMSSPFPGPPKMQLRHRQRRGAGAAALHRRPARRRARQAQPAAQVLSQPPAHARRQRRHAARPAGLARFLSRLLPRQERRLERQHAASAEVAHRRGNGEDAALLRDAEGQGHGRQQSRRSCRPRRRSRPANG